MRTAWKNFNLSVSMFCVSNLTVVYFYHLLDLVVRRHCLLTITWMFCTITAFCADDFNIFISRSAAAPAAAPARHELIHHDFSHRGCSILDSSLWILACCWHCSSFHGSSGPSLAVFLCPSRPSDPCSPVHLSRCRLRSGYCFVLPARAAYFFFCLFPG